MKAVNLVNKLLEADNVDDFDAKEEVFRYMSSVPLRYNELRRWRPYIHTPHGDGAYFNSFIVPVFTATGRLSKAHSYCGWTRMKQFTYNNPPTWEQRVDAVQAVVPNKLPGFKLDWLKRRGFLIGEPYDPYEGKFYTHDQHDFGLTVFR